MIGIARIVCWLCLVVILIGIGALYRYNPNIVRSYNFVPLLPFAIALVAFYAESNRWLIWSAIVVNGLMALLGCVLFVVGVLGQMATPWVGLVMGGLFIGLAGLNVVALRVRLLTLVTA